MKQAPNHRLKLTRRLLPLYFAAFLHGFVLWYAIEKLFMHGIGFNDAGIGVMVAFYCALMLLAETPSGILADRWSRKGVLIIASIILAISSILCGISTEPSLFVVGSMMWGLFYALYSGTYDAIIYDTILEETGTSAMYERSAGRFKIVEGFAWALGSIVGGIIAEFVGLRETFYWSVPIALMAIIALAVFKEPILHKAEPLGTIRQQVRDTFKAVLGRSTLMWLLVAIISLSLLTEIMFEFSQLWLIAIATPVIVFGPAYALLMVSVSIGGWVAGRGSASRKTAVFILLTVLCIAAAALGLTMHMPIIVLAQMLIGVCGTVLSIWYMHSLHDTLPSRLRAGASSTVNTIFRLVLIPLGLLFGVLSASINIFATSWVLLGLLGVIIGASWVMYKREPTLK